MRHNALRLLQARDQWAELVVALRLRRDRDERVAKVAWLWVAKWRSVPASVFTQPTAAQRAELIRRSGDLADAPQTRKVLETLLTYGQPTVAPMAASGPPEVAGERISNRQEGKLLAPLVAARMSRP